MKRPFRHLLCFSLAALLLIGWGAAFFFEDDRGERREHPIFPPAPYVIELPPAFYEEREEPAGRYAAIGEEMTDEERALSALMIYHEARGESEEGQRAVAEVLCNRILSELYPDTAKEVIYQQNQFSCADALTTAPVREPACLAKAFDILHEVLEETEYLLPETYDVNIKYKSGGTYKTYAKKGFATKRAAKQHEAVMRQKLMNPSYVPPTAPQRKITVREYLDEWLERHGSTNLRPSTKASYGSHIRNHINPYIGDLPLSQVTPAILDDLFQKLYEKGLSGSSVKYAHRILGVAFEHARKYHYIETNPVRDTITKFGKQGKTPDPYTIEQMRALLANVNGTQWELAIILAGLYGLRLSECIGLRWRNVDFSKKTFAVIEQLPYGLPAGTKIVSEMAPVKSSERVLPITQATMAYFERQFAQRAEQKKLFSTSEEPYFDNELVISKANGIPARRERISANFGQLLRQLGMPHMRFHDLRHTAATNMHQLTGDFYTVGQILGHSLKGVGIQLGMGSNLESVTAQYVDVRLDRKRIVLEAYHNEVLKGK